MLVRMHSLFIHVYTLYEMNDVLKGSFECFDIDN